MAYHIGTEHAGFSLR